jgi:hypothetical protein
VRIEASEIARNYNKQASESNNTTSTHRTGQHRTEQNNPEPKAENRVENTEHRDHSPEQRPGHKKNMKNLQIKLEKHLTPMR